MSAPAEGLGPDAGGAAAASEGRLDPRADAAPPEPARPEPPPSEPPPDPPPESVSPVPTLAVEVVWGDVTRVSADVYAVGHYEQVLPQNAERALDAVVSGAEAGADALVLTGLSRRGILRGALGDVNLFPWAADAERAAAQAEGAEGDPATPARRRVVAVAGMGYPGSFNAIALRRLARNLATTVAFLPDARTVCTVLIGAGGGNLTVADAVRGLFEGIADALAPDARRPRVERLRVVERELGRARAIHRELGAVAASPELGRRIRLAVDARIHAVEGGAVGADYAMALTIAAAAHAAQGADEAGRVALDGVLGLVPDPARFREHATEALRTLAAVHPGDHAAVAARLSVRVDADRPRQPAPTRVSFVRDGTAICAAALTDTVVIPERRLEVDDSLLDAAVAAMTDPPAERVRELSAFLARLVVPRDFRAALEQAPQLVVEVDRDTARLHWEMLGDRVDADATPLALRIDVARQLRTSYSAPPGGERVARWPLRALVVGDPGDPRRGDDLPAARREALAVTRLLRARGVEVAPMIGAPTVARTGELAGIEPADRLAVLMRLLRGGYDLLHYAGHGDFDPTRPESTGWVFEGGLLTSRLLERVDLAPSLVVANACLSARTSDALARGKGTSAVRARSEADLLPSLADEFFRRGVRNYVGTAWAVDDQGAVTFAQTFYEALVPPVDAATGRPVRGGATVGAALRDARVALRAREGRYGALWAAYQHYGDPQHVLVPDGLVDG